MCFYQHLSLSSSLRLWRPVFSDCCGLQCKPCVHALCEEQVNRSCIYELGNRHCRVEMVS